MKAAIFRKGEIVVGEVAEPQPGRGQVLVKTIACGICGTDLHARDACLKDGGDVTLCAPGAIPMDLTRDVVFGHEYCCEILDFGPGDQAPTQTRVAGDLGSTSRR